MQLGSLNAAVLFNEFQIDHSNLPSDILCSDFEGPSVRGYEGGYRVAEELFRACRGSPMVL